MLKGVLSGNPASALADDDSELAFEVNVLGLFGINDRITVSCQGGRGLQKQERLGRDFVTELSSVLDIVSADANDFGRPAGRQNVCSFGNVAPENTVVNTVLTVWRVGWRGGICAVANVAFHGLIVTRLKREAV
jgi:hypothetical protein